MAGATLLRRLAGVAAIVAAAVAVVFVVRGSSTERAGCDKTFDAGAWKQQEGRNSGFLTRSDRLVMAERLVRCGTLERKTRAQVRALLGRPEFPDPRPESGGCYELEGEPELGSLDNRTLCLSYDRSGRIEGAAVSS
jgi:hypothetical protein